MKKLLLTSASVAALFAAPAYAQSNTSDVTQSGNANQATVNQPGTLNGSDIDQTGNNNVAVLTQNGSGNSSDIDQATANNANVEQLGTSGESIVEQNGSQNDVINHSPPPGYPNAGVNTGGAGVRQRADSVDAYPNIVHNGP